MRFIGITNQGLVVIGLLVATLWGLIFAEQRFANSAKQDYREVLRALPSTPKTPKSTPVQEAIPYNGSSNDTELT